MKKNNNNRYIPEQEVWGKEFLRRWVDFLQDSLIYRWRYQIVSYSNSQPPREVGSYLAIYGISSQPDINCLWHTISFIMTPGYHSLNYQLSSTHDVSNLILKDTSTAPLWSTNNATNSQRKIVPEDGLVRSPPSLESQKRRRGRGYLSGQILIFIRIAIRVSLHQDHPERNCKLEYLP